MNTTAVIVVAVIVIAALVAIGLWLYGRRQRSAALREQFGPEYQRAVTTYGARSRAEHELAQRADRVESLHIRELAVDEARRFGDEWRQIQTQFVDDPRGAIGDADRLVGEVMHTRGYPVSNFEQRAADVSVDHADVVEHYRTAHALAGRAAHDEIETEDMRQALVHYRYLFEALITPQTVAREEMRR